MSDKEQPLPETVEEVMERMPARFNSKDGGRVKATIQFKFTGDEPGEWVATIANGKCSTRRGTADNPNVTINSPSEVWLKITRRELDGATAFISGQFSFTGDMGILMRMNSWFGGS